MADISKCKGMNCDIKKECYRYMCIGNMYSQSYILLQTPIPLSATKFNIHNDDINIHDKNIYKCAYFMEDIKL